jgi:SAM-dependent methyltransferase
MKEQQDRGLQTIAPPAWPAYNELAWTDILLATPEEAAEDTERLCRIMKEGSGIEVRRLLHLGCGAGANDFTFKKYFRVTGVDVSPGMLAIARSVNPEVAYVEGDMRTVRLAERFEAVAIPDSIDYMVTRADLEAAIRTAEAHLEPGGVLLVVAHVQEEFEENNFAYSGARGELEVTVFENNRIGRPEGDRYEATLVYLIRRSGELEIRTDSHTLGLFPEATWIELLEGAGFGIESARLDHSYDRYLLEGSAYRQRIFIGRKPL